MSHIGNLSCKHIQLSKKSDDGSLYKFEADYGDYDVNWRNIIFLPFSNSWELFIMCSVVVNVFILVYDVAYDQDKSSDTTINFLYYCFEIIYFFDTALRVAHRNMPRYRGIREHEPKTMISLLVDIITLLPIYEVYLLLRATSRTKVHTINARNIIRTKSLFRLYRLYEYFSKMIYYAGINQTLIVFVGHYLKLIILTHLVGALWYVLGCWKCKKPNWTINLKDNIFDAKNPMEWLTICYTTIGNVFAHNWRGSIRAEVATETLIIIATMLIGYITHFMIYFGQLTRAYIKSFRRQFIFVDNLNSIKHLLEDFGIEKEWKDKTVEYYNVFWEKRYGIKTMPKIFRLLPAPLQKEVTVDIFWEALRHSHLYGQEDISFKRALSLEMKSEFFLPGDYVYKLNKIKSKMVYIVSGILQVLTAEDEESPVISFSSGTVLGEMACLLPSKSIANVRCATYCELHTLSIYSLYRVLKNYPGKSRSLQARLKERLETTQNIYEYYSDGPQTLSSDFTSTTQDSSIKWIKLQWRKLAKHQRSSKKIEPVEVSADPAHCSDYLDLLVLSEEVELKMQVICLRGFCPFVLEPNSSFRRFCHYLVILTAIIQSLVLPYNVAFERRISNKLFSICFVLDLIYFTDIYLKMSTAIKTRDRLISTASTIVVERMKEISFLIDIAATIPVDYIAVMFGMSDHVAALLKLNRLLKIYQVIDFINTRENSIWMDSLNARLAKYLFLYILVCYWFSCFMFALTCFHETCFYYGWLHYNDVLDKAAGFPVAKYKVSFMTSFFYVLSTCLSISISARYQYIAGDIWAYHFVIILSYYLFSYCYSGLCATFVLRLEKRKTYYDYISSMLEFLKINKITGTLKNNVINMLEFWWYYNENADVFTEEGILKDATSELKDKIFKQRIKRCLVKVPLFEKCDDKLIDMIAEISEVKALPSNTEVISANYRTPFIHIILRGYCQLKSIMAGDFERDSVTTLKYGDAFPVVEVLHQVMSLINVKTITAVELISIKYSELIEILLAHPKIGKQVTDAVEYHFAKFEGPLLRKKGRLPEMIPAEHSLGPGDMFTYEIYDDDELNPERTAYLKPFLKLGKWSFLRYVLLQTTIDPHKKFFLCWEVFRCIFAIMRIILVFTYFNLLVEYRDITTIMLRFFDLTATLDFYVRLHCQYYNEKGITVTHPWATAKHYVTTSFPIDLIATLPFRQLQIDQLLGYQHREIVYTVLSLIARPWQLHRLMGFINYLQIQKSSKLLQTIKYTVLVVVVIGTLTVVIQVATCTIHPPDSTGHIKIECNKDSWIMSTPLTNQMSHVDIYIQCFYAAVVLFTASTSGGFIVTNYGEACLFAVLFVATFIFRVLIYAKVTSHRDKVIPITLIKVNPNTLPYLTIFDPKVRRREHYRENWFINLTFISMMKIIALIGGNVNLTIYQERVKSFLDFVQAEYIDEGLIQHTIEHYQYIWKKTQGSNITSTLKKFHANLHEAVAYTLYGTTLEAVELFQGADNSFFRQLGVHMQVQHFKKDSEIIRCNDVQGLMFIVYRGKIDIFLAGTKACSLGQGGIFGCLEKQGITRQTITAVAKVHVELLVINSNQFHAIIGKFINFTERLQQSNFFHTEYAESKKRVYFGFESEMSQTSKLISTTSILGTCISKLYDKTKLLINPDDGWYKLWQYIIYVHVASITSLIFMFYIIMSQRHAPIRSYLKGIIYIQDVIFLVKIYIGFHLAYVDVESGILIRDHTLIRKKYLKSYRFWFDILTCFPFEIFVGLITDNVQYIRYSMVNRIFRFMYLVEYYKQCEDKLYVKRHLRWTYLLYLICINIQFGTCVWWLAACIDDHCFYNISTDRKDRLVFVKAKAGVDSILLAYEYVVNLFTMTGLQVVRPLNKVQVLLSIVIISAFQYTAIALASEFATMLSVEQFSMSTYEFNIQELRTYLQGCELSPPIVDKVWKYSSQLWQRQRGEWMPAIVTKAPGYLKQDLMIALYGQHLQNHFLFGHTHVDFLRQLVVHLQRCVFFPGNYLAEKGDMDGSMYFIHDGEVEVYDKHGNNEILRLVLRRDQSFGEAQGLHCIPHDSSYKARTVVDALILRWKDWEYLLNWFPASKEEIHLKAVENRLKHTVVIETSKINIPSNEGAGKPTIRRSLLDDELELM